MNHPAPLAPTSRSAAVPELRALLARYPALDGSELDRLAQLMKTAPLLEVGMLSSDPELGGRYQAFRAGETVRLRPTPWEIAKFVALYLGPGALFVWAAVQMA